MTNKEKGLGLFEVVQELKNEIQRLEQDTESPYYFKIERAEVELSVAVEKKGEGVSMFGLFKLAEEGKKRILIE